MSESTLALSVDGGGVRSAIIASEILKHVEALCCGKSKFIFDIFSGCSGGSLVAASSANGMTANEIQEMVYSFSDSAFERGFRQRLRTINGLVGAKYREDGLIDTLDRVFGDTAMVDIPEKLCVPITDMVKNEPLISKSHTPTHNRDLLLVKHILYSSSAAPLYFPYWQDRYGDGGLWAYRTDQIAYAEAKYLWSELPVKILSIGSGQAKNPRRVPNRNPISHLKKVAEAVTESQARMGDWTNSKISDMEVYRVEPTVEADMDDTSKETLDTLRESVQGLLGVVDNFVESL